MLEHRGKRHALEMSDERIVAKAEMLIRKPVTNVFEAFVDPMITSKFWFSRGSAKLEAGKTVRWDWKMYRVLETAKVDSQTSHPARATGQCESQNPSSLISVTPVSSDRGRETYSTFRSVTIIDGAQRLPSSERSWCAVKVLSLSVNTPLQRWCVACHVQIPSRRVNVSVIAFPA